MSAEDVARGKAQLIAAVMDYLGSESQLISDMAGQAALLGNVQSAAQICSAIEGIAAADVNAVRMNEPKTQITLVIMNSFFIFYFRRLQRKCPAANGPSVL